jgi:hypothetical protein
MPYRNSVGLVSAATDNEAPKAYATVERRKPSRLYLKAEQLIQAELIGSSECRALRLVVRGAAPVLSLCRQLILTGHNPDLPLEAWRGGVRALRIRSIGIAAGLTVSDDRLGRPRFRRWPSTSDVGAAPSARNGLVRT